MTRPPFGFGPSGGSGEGEGEDPQDPFGLSKMFGGAGGNLFAQLQRLMSWTGGPVNWDLAREVALGTLGEQDRAVTADERREIADAGRLADVWLDPVTALPAAGQEPQAWTRLEWLERTQESWRQLVDPVAGRVTEAMGTAMGQALTQGLEGGALPPELSGMLGGLGGGLGPNPFGDVMKQVGGLVFGAQVGQALGALAGEVLSSTEIGLPLGRSALLPANVADFAEGLEVPLDEVRLYLALREAAHQRLFAHVPWLRAHLFDAVDAYARGIDIDLSALESAVGSFDPTDPEALQQALGEGGMFTLEPTPAQQAALARLEAALALVEGWVDLVVDEAATPLPHAVALRETVRRRRASGGPAEQTFATLVGLQLRPRRLREAAALWQRLTEEKGVDGRDALWAHPDLLPGAAELDDPAAQEPASEVDWDAGLRELDKDLDGELDADAASSYGEDGSPGGADGPAGSDGPEGPDGPDAPG